MTKGHTPLTNGRTVMRVRTPPVHVYIFVRARVVFISLLIQKRPRAV